MNFHISFLRWAKETPDGGDYDAEVTEEEIGNRTVEQYLPEGVTLKTSFSEFKTIRKILNSVKPDEAGIYPVLTHLEINLAGATPYVPPSKKPTPAAPAKVSWWHRLLQSFGLR